MLRFRGCPHLYATLVMIGVAIGCGSGGDITEPAVGTLEVTSTTTGPEPDQDGYNVSVDGIDRGALPATGGLTINGLTPDNHLVGLTGIAGNCQIKGENPRAVTVTAGAGATVAFVITCTAPPDNAGSLRITTATTGADQDADGYLFAIDGGPTQSIGANTAITLNGVPAGAQTVSVSGVATNCTVGGGNTRQVTVTAGQTATAEFIITCTALAAYRAVDLGTLGGNYSVANGINLAGQVVGYTEVSGGGAARRAFLWDSGVMTLLGNLGGNGESSASAINSAGEIVGYSAVDDGGIHAFLWRNGVMTDLGVLQDRGHHGSYAVAINPSGQVVGVSELVTDDGFDQRAFLWEKGVMRDLGRFSPSGINPAGQVVGSANTATGQTRAFLWENGAMTDLGTLGGDISIASGINPAGQVVGSSYTSDGRLHGFLWDKGVMTDLGTLAEEGEIDQTVANAINPAGLVVGSSPFHPRHAFVWEKGVMTDLGTLGGDHSTALAINPAGDIVGYAATPANDAVHATLWTRR